jgi:hypothetical protein
MIPNMIRSESLSKLLPALIAARASMPPVTKDAQNPHFKSRYATLANVIDACEATLAKNGLAVLQATELGEHGLALVTTLAHTSGEWVQARYPLPNDPAHPQIQGSALTYARRYGYLCIVGVAPEDDDDAEAASGPGQNAPARAPSPAPPPARNGTAKSRTDWDRNRYPERARQSSAPAATATAPAPAQTGERPPRTGPELYRWIMSVQEDRGVGLLEHVAAFGKDHGYPGKITAWSPVMVKQAHAEALAALELIYSAADPDDAAGYQDTDGGDDGRWDDSREY